MILVIIVLKFNDIKYKRLDFEQIKKELNKLIKKLETENNYDEYLKCFKEIIHIQNHIEEMHDYSDIKNMRDSQDEYFNNEMDYWNEYKPKFDLLFKPFYEHCLKSSYKSQLSEVVPENFFNTINYEIKISSNKILELQKTENDLQFKYRKIMREKVLFDGKERNLSNISGYFSHQDRDIRKKAHDCANDFYYKHQAELDDIMYKLIDVRNTIAKKVGFDNYSTYSLYKLRRFGYDYKDISKFRNGVIKHIVPLCNKLNEWKKKELGIEKIEYYDTIYFKDMPELLFSGKQLLTAFGETLKEINYDAYNLYNKMLENDYIDLETRDNKVNFFITNYLSESSLPVITGNFKGAYTDFQTLSHEFGHAFQKYNASLEDRNHVVSSLLKYPTFEIAEMFSHAMELLCMKKADKLFSSKDYNKYCFMKIYNFVTMMPYMCLVDEFQEVIYSGKKIEKEAIRKVWIELSFKYGFDKNNEGHKNLESGGYFYRQSHIILNPFYYIDYALSYLGAFAIFEECKNSLDTFNKMSREASYYPFKELINKYKIENPFDEKSMCIISKILEDELLKYKAKNN